MVALTNSNGIEVWDVTKNTRRSRRDADGVGTSVFSPNEENRSGVLQLSFDPSGDFLASADKSEIIVRSAKKHAEASRITLAEGYTTKELMVSPGGRYAAASSSTGEVRPWDTSSINHAGTPLRFKGEKSMIFSPSIIQNWSS
jgi:WD40 repeat protein